MKLVRDDDKALDLDALEAAVPELGDVAEGREAEVLGRLGSVKLRVAALEAGLVGRVLARTNSRRKTTEPDRLLSVADTAKLLGVSKDYVYEHKHELPMVRQGRRLLFSASGLERLIRQRRGAMLRPEGGNR